ncbi:aminotransferase class III-fold pyridoxal phosphate-dependent enzyme, partial [Streptomyces sp. NPDC127079]|uniref:aminotransferase class III-fold pyridoxal phosphate-dependent enzyme n=1 Tax=Streptomyces sp. NPDC127079 TaxID=3347132 RepID=UPI00365CF027
ATLAHVRENALADRARLLGTRMFTRLRGLQDDFACVGEVRGRGLMIGVEMVDPEAERSSGQGEPTGSADPTGSRDGRPAGPDSGATGGWDGDAGPGPYPAAPGLAAAVQRACLERGLIVELGGRHAGVVRLLPPLTITDEQAEAVLDRLADAVAAVARDPSARHGVRPAQGSVRTDQGSVRKD